MHSRLHSWKSSCICTYMFESDNTDIPPKYMHLSLYMSPHIQPHFLLTAQCTLSHIHDYACINRRRHINLHTLYGIYLCTFLQFIHTHMNAHTYVHTEVYDAHIYLCAHKCTQCVHINAHQAPINPCSHKCTHIFTHTHYHTYPYTNIPINASVVIFF